MSLLLPLVFGAPRNGLAAVGDGGIVRFWSGRLLAGLTAVGFPLGLWPCFEFLLVGLEGFAGRFDADLVVVFTGFFSEMSPLDLLGSG